MKILLNLLIVLSILSAAAQAPDLFNYQGVVQNPDGTPIENARFPIQISILNTLDGSPIYTEVHEVETNSNGVFSVQIGNGVPTLGTFAAIDWVLGLKFLQTSIDLDGGTNFQVMGTSQLVSVPYALHAATAEDVDDADADPTNEIELPEQAPGDAALFLQADGIGGVIYVSDNVEDADSDPVNEIQDLDLTGGTLTLTNDPTPSDIILTPFLGNNTDEQIVNFDGTNLSITGGTGGNSVDISGVDNQIAVEVPFDNATSGLTATNVQAAVDELVTDLDQAWLLSGNAPGALGVLGTADDNDLSIISNNLEVIRVESGGNVGIGIPDPLHALHVQGQTANSTSLNALEALIGSTYETGMIASFTESDPENHNNIGAAFMVDAPGTNYGIVGMTANNTATNNRGVWAVASGASDSNRGLNGNAYGTGTSISSIAVFGHSEASNENTGVSGQAIGSSTSFNKGGFFLASGSGTINRGVDVTASGVGTFNDGFYARVLDGDQNRGIYTQATGTASEGNIGGEFRGQGSGTINKGVQAIASGSGTSNDGFYAQALDGDQNRGIYTQATGTASEGNIGGEFRGLGSGTINKGVQAIASGSGTSNDGFYAQALDGDQNRGIYTQATGTASEGNIGGEFRGQGSGTINKGVQAIASGSGTSNDGFYAQALDGDQNRGIYTQATGTASDGNIGGEFRGTGSGTTNEGVHSLAQGSGVENRGLHAQAFGASDSNRGVYSQAAGTEGDNYGVYAVASGTTGGTNFGVYGHAEDGDTNYAGYFQGDVTINSGNFEVTTGTINGTVAYDNTTSGLAATNVKSAIDELGEAIQPAMRNYLVEDDQQIILNGDAWTDLTGFNANIEVDRDGSSIQVTIDLAPVQFTDFHSWLGLRIRLGNTEFTNPSILNSINHDYTPSSQFSFLLPNVDQGTYQLALQWRGRDDLQTYTISSFEDYDPIFGFSRMIITVMP